MTFIANANELRTFDPERGFQLITAGGGPGYSNFILRGADFQFHFSGNPLTVPIEGVDQSLHASVSKTLIWQVFNHSPSIPDRSVDETRQLITEALAAFKGVHGNPAGQAVEVQFNTKTDGEF